MLFFLIALLLGMSIGYRVGQRASPSPPPQVIVRTDTIAVQKVLRDTVVKTFTQIRYRIVPPETVVLYKTRVETLRTVTFVGLDYFEPHLTLYVQDSIFQKWTWNVGPEFIVRQTARGFFRQGETPLVPVLWVGCGRSLDGNADLIA